MTYTGVHTKDCGYHLDQYESECTCGVSMTQKGEAVGMVER